MAESTLEKVYSRLPHSVVRDCEEAGMSQEVIDNPKAFLGTFLQENTTRNHMQDGDLTYKVHFLDNMKKKPPWKEYDTKGKKTKKLTARERKKLKLFKIDASEQKYELFEPLHELWKDYIREIVDFSKITEKNKADALAKLIRADYHGAIIKVSRSKCTSLIGLSGILVQETKNTFIIITKDDKMKTIPKENSVFTYEIDGYTGTIYGRQFTVTAAERIHKKFKSKPNIDL